MPKRPCKGMKPNAQSTVEERRFSAASAAEIDRGFSPGPQPNAPDPCLQCNHNPHSQNGTHHPRAIHVEIPQPNPAPSPSLLGIQPIVFLS
jgi:hypothetical protein